MSNALRIDLKNRMECKTVRMYIDDRLITVTLDFEFTETGAMAVAIWVRVKPDESTLGRELRASGKSNSLLLQSGWSLKEISDTLTKDNIMGCAVTYVAKHLEEIFAGIQPDKTPRMTTDPYKIK